MGPAEPPTRPLPMLPLRLDAVVLVLAWTAGGNADPPRLSVLHTRQATTITRAPRGRPDGPVSGILRVANGKTIDEPASTPQ